MLEFIKMFGLGILYTLLLPFIVVFFALSLVFVFANYLVLESKTLFGFFFGYTFTTDTELEEKLQEMKDNGKRDDENPDASYEYIDETVSDSTKGSDEE